MVEFISFFLVLLAALVFSNIFSRFHIPWVVSLILAGIIIGPFGLGWFSPNSTINFLSELGLIFLMFMAGVEVKLSSIKQVKKDVGIIALLNGSIPFIVGTSIGFLFGFGFITSILLGIIFISSSVAGSIPTLESTGLIDSKVGRTIVATNVFQDMISLFLLSIILQTTNPASMLPLPLFYVILIMGLVSFRIAVPKIQEFFKKEFTKNGNSFEMELEEIFVVLMGSVLFFELIGLHPIIAGFFAGVVLSESIRKEVLKEKLRAIGYGFLIPIFFVVIGSKTNIGVFAQIGPALLLTTIIVLGSILSKFFSGMIGGRLTKFNKTESSLIGSATIPQLSTTLAVVFTGTELGILNESIATAMIILSIITTLVGPSLMNYIISTKSEGFTKKRTEPIKENPVLASEK